MGQATGRVWDPTDLGRAAGPPRRRAGPVGAGSWTFSLLSPMPTERGWWTRDCRCGRWSRATLSDSGVHPGFRPRVRRPRRLRGHRGGRVPPGLPESRGTTRMGPAGPLGAGGHRRGRGPGREGAVRRDALQRGRDRRGPAARPMREKDTPGTGPTDSRRRPETRHDPGGGARRRTDRGEGDAGGRDPGFQTADIVNALAFIDDKAAGARPALRREPVAGDDAVVARRAVAGGAGDRTPWSGRGTGKVVVIAAGNSSDNGTSATTTSGARATWG